MFAFTQSGHYWSLSENITKSIKNYFTYVVVYTWFVTVTSRDLGVVVKIKTK